MEASTDEQIKIEKLYDRVNYLSWITDLKGMAIVTTSYGFDVFTHEGYFFQIHKLTSVDGYEQYEFNEPWKDFNRAGLDKALFVLLKDYGS